MSAPTWNVEGVLVTDAVGRAAFATGIGRDPRVQSLAGDKPWIEEARSRRLQPLTLDRRGYAVLTVPLSEGDLIIFGRPPGNAVLDFLGSVGFAYDILEHVLTDPFDALTVVDADGFVRYISPVHESFFGLARGEANGRPVREIIENTGLDRVVATGKAEVGEIQRMKGLERVVSRVPVRRDGKVVGAVGRIMFKGPKQVEELSRRINMLESKVEFYRREAAALRDRTYGLESLIGESPAMRNLRANIVKVAPLEIPVLIRGESGTGKELVAYALHRLSPRRDASMVMVNAAALPATLVESELFGYEPGAFTGADRKGRKGKFEQAAGGTILLDEIGDMPTDVQAKLLRVLQDRMVQRIGGERPYEVDFRLVSATNRDLQALVADDKFRLDLYYRISPIVIDVPPLRARIDDIPNLAVTFLREVAERHGRSPPEIAPNALTYLMDQAWPGNVRQLRHEIERAFVFAENGRITAETLAQYDDSRAWPAPSFEHAHSRSPSGSARLKEAVERVESELVRDAMARHRGNKKRVAKDLGISRSYLYKKLGLSEETP